MTKRKPRPRAAPDPVAQPHDSLVRYAFSKLAHARGLLRAILPEDLVAAIRWNTLRLEKDTFVPPDLRKRYADLLFSVRVDSVEVRIYILLEHQRCVEPLMMLRILGYVVRILEAIVRETPSRGTIPAVLPLLLASSKQGWTAATSFEAIVELPQGALRHRIVPHVPRFDALPVDLHPDHATAIRDQWLTAFGKLVLWALSVAGDNPRFLAEIDRMQAAIREALAAPDGTQALAALLMYISATHERLGAERFEQALRATAGKNARKIMTVLEELELRGAHKARAQMLLDQLAARFGRVPAATRARIQTADDATLARWSIRVLSEPSIDAVLDGAATKPAKKKTAIRKHTRASTAA